jgi:TolB-like protein/Flp pilus assembly protein TadD
MEQLIQELKRRNVLRVAIAYLVSAWLLIQVTETIFPLFGFGHGPARVVVLLLATGFPLALVFSWIYELTPDGLKLENEIDRSKSITPHTGKTLDRTIIAVLTLAVGYFAVDKFVLDPVRDEVLTETVTGNVRDEILIESYGQQSIAVLPFVNMSDDASNEYFSDGISEEVLNLLARISELRVISRSSTFSFKGKDITMPAIADQLNVAHVLEGSVRKAGNTVRITVQLIEARTDTHLWSETYDRELDDIFAIQDEIAATVVDKLKVTLLGKVPQSQPLDTEAYSLFLHARQLRRLQTTESLREAEKLYRQSLALEPNYAPSWVGLGAVYDNQVITDQIPYEEGMALAQSAVERALQIDPNSAAALDSLGWILDKQSNDIAQAAAYVGRALELEPNDLDVLASAARILQNLRRLEEASVIRKYVVARDPLNPIRYNNIGALNIYSRDYNEAKANMERIIELSPDYLGARYFVGLTDLLLGDATAALASFELEGDQIWLLKGKAMANHSLGNDEAANEALEELIAVAGETWPSEIAHVYAFRNDSENAFKWLENSLDTGGGWAEEKLNPLFDNLHGDPRWQAFFEKLGLSDAQLAKIEFDVTLPTAESL